VAKDGKIKLQLPLNEIVDFVQPEYLGLQTSFVRSILTRPA